MYAITDAGRAAVADWLAQPGGGPTLEFEGMLKVAFADLGTRDDLLARLTDIAEDAELRLALGAEVARRYLDGQGAFPDRLHVSGLAWRFLHDHFRMVRDWAHWALAEVTTWPDVHNPPGGPLATFARYQPEPGRGRKSP